MQGINVECRNCNSKQKSNNGKCQCECKKPIKHRACEEKCACNPSICAYECNKDCKIAEFFKSHTCTKNLIHDLLVTYDEISDTPETASINSNNKTIFLFICVVLLGIGCLLLLAFITVRYHMKHGLIIPDLISI